MSETASIDLPPERPRVLIGRGFLDVLRRRASSTHEEECARLLLWARNLPHRPDADFEPEGLAEHALIRVSLLHAMRRETALAESAARMAKLVLAKEPTSRYGTGCRRLEALASYHDWCHAAIPEAGRARVVASMLRYVELLYRDEMDIIPGGPCYTSGHAINQIPAILSAGLTLCGEHPRGAEIVRDCLARLGGMFRVYEHFLSEGSFHLWWAYGLAYFRELPVLFTLAERGLGLDWWNEHRWFENCVHWMLYGLRDDWSWPRTGDFFGAGLGVKPGVNLPDVRRSPPLHLVLAAIAGRYRNGHAGWLLSKLRPAGSKEAGLFGIEDARLIYEDRPYPVEHPRSLPPSRHFPRAGVLVSREGWLEGPHVVMKATPVYLHNHSHRDAASFAVYHRGPLALDSGTYDAYESPHWHNYYIRTVAHNAVLVRDPAERFTSRGRDYANDGGQRFVNEPHFSPRRYEELFIDEFSSCRTLAASARPEFDHMHVDATRAYSPAKLEYFTRHMALVRRPPAWPHPVMVVRDLVVTAKAGLDVAWLLHTANEPAIAGNRATASAGGGRLHCVSLLPSGAEMLPIGGPGREFEVAGENFAPTRAHVSCEPGSWRIEDVLRAASPGRHELLHVLFIADVEDAALPDARMVECSRGSSLAAGGVLFVFAEGAAELEITLAEPVSAALVLELGGALRVDIEGPVRLGAPVSASASAYLAGALPAGAYRLAAR